MLKKIENSMYQYIIEFTENNGYAPSIRELQKEFGFKSTSTVVYHLDKLDEMGLIKREPGKNRVIKTKDESVSPERIASKYNLTTIPLVGDITAGVPILAEENYQETFFIPTSLFRGDDLFMLNVNGSSMINAGICDGDKLILRKQSTARNGEIVAVMLDNRATVKRFYKEDGYYRLQPENPLMSPIICKSVDILGKVIGLIRKF